MSNNIFNRFLYNYAPLFGGLALIVIAAIILCFVVFEKFF